MCSDAPDTSGINAAAVQSAQLGQDALNWFKGEYARTQGQRDASTAIDNQVAQAQLASMQQQTSIAKDYYDYSKGTFRPLEEKLVADAQAYDTPERRAAAAEAAVADVNKQAAAQRQAATASMASYGGAVDGAKMASILDSGAVNTAKVAAGAAKAARDRVEDVGFARMSDAANMGRGLPSAQTAAITTGTQAGNSAVGAAGAGLAAANSGAGMMQTGFAQGMQGAGQAGQLYGTAAGIDAQTRGQDLNFMSSVFGSFMKSDPKVKKDRKPVTPEASMAALRDLPIESWKYDTDKGGPEDGGRTRIGPMADAANEEMGEEVAPGGELLNVASMMGVVANAVKNLDQRVARMEQRKVA